MQIDIEAPPADVWAVALDPTRLKDWVTIHRHLGAHDDGAPRVGFTMTQTLSLRGAPFRVHWELVRCEEPQRRRVARSRPGALARGDRRTR